MTLPLRDSEEWDDLYNQTREAFLANPYDFMTENEIDELIEKNMARYQDSDQTE